ncbi:MAG: hypothetical protein ACI9OO_000401 [Bacteroidia bacterium]|jgi:hypothetical protein
MGASRRGDIDGAVDSIDERGGSTSEDAHNLTSRERIRRRLAADIDAFLSKGGHIQHLDNSVEQVGDTDLF